MFEVIIHSCLLLILIYISYKDLREGIIPDLATAVVVLLGLIQCGLENFISVIILGTLSYGLYKFYPWWRGKEGIGFGDVKLLAAFGLWLPPFQIPIFLILTGIFGVALALIWQALKKEPQFPFGPALALALGICIVGINEFPKGDTHMTQTFSGPSLAPASGKKPTSIVVLIHGYGANGDDLLSLGNAWAELLPDTLFVAPHGPTVCEMNPAGNQWFDLRDWDPGRIIKEVQNLTPAFNQYLDNLLKANDLSNDKLALVGFSQGAMLAMHIGLHRPQCAGVVAYSGGFLEDPKELIIARPPILLVHGDQDDVIGHSFSEQAEERFKSLGIPVNLSILTGLGHGIDPRGLAIGGKFLKDHLYKNPDSNLWEEAKQGNK